MVTEADTEPVGKVQVEFTIVTAIVIGSGSSIVNELVVVHPFASVTVTVYVPALVLEIVGPRIFVGIGVVHL